MRMYKQWFGVAAMLSVGIAWFMLTGCGSEELGQPEMANIGTLEQPLYVSDYYGILKSNQQRCPAGSWGQDMCKMPDRRDWIFTYPTPGTLQCPGSSNPAAAEIVGSIETAAREASFQLNSRGWNTSVEVWNGSQFDDRHIQILCNTSVSNTSGEFGYTEAPFVCGVGVDCNSSSRGTVGQFKYADVIFRHGYLYNNDVIWGSPDGFKTLPEWKRRNVITNVVLHELMHVAGLGHPISGYGTSQHKSQLMNSPTTSAQLTLMQNQIVSLTSYEGTMLDCYNESSSQTPQCN